MGNKLCQHCQCSWSNNLEEVSVNVTLRMMQFADVFPDIDMLYFAPALDKRFKC